MTLPSSGPQDGMGGGADRHGSSTERAHDVAGPMSFGLRMTFEEFGMPLPSVSAEYACGRLAALEMASALGSRQARRALARERQSLLRRCFPTIDPTRLEGD